jgi:hypothetical protein
MRVRVYAVGTCNSPPPGKGEIFDVAIPPKMHRPNRLIGCWEGKRKARKQTKAKRKLRKLKENQKKAKSTGELKES